MTLITISQWETDMNMVEPRGAAYDSNGSDVRAGNESELTALVRRWMVAGNRGRRDGLLRVAPAPQAAPQPEPAAEPVPEILDHDVQPDHDAHEDHDDHLDPGETAAPPAEAASGAGPELRAPALPHRPTMAETEHAMRMAVLIDARRVSEDTATGLLSLLGERGSVNVCRAYADWTRADLGSWVGKLRRQGLHSFHQFADDDDQALVAMAIDAVDIAREASVDEVVIAGDMTSMLPLVHRLHAAGVRVVVVGPGHTPHDVRAACDEFLDAESLVGESPAVGGRHRA